MRKYPVLVLAGALSGACGGVSAQTPAPNPMPDGSYDMYAGLGVRSAPNYEGSRERGLRLTPVLQIAWGNGVFISGMSAGMHLSPLPGLEFGPLLSVHAARSKDGSSVFDTPVDATGAGTGSAILPPKAVTTSSASTGATGVDVAAPGTWYKVRRIGPRLEGGAFLNYYLTRQLRLTNNLLYGAGDGRDGLRWTLGLQRIAFEVAPHQKLSLAVGVTVVNRAYNTSYFGLRDNEIVTVPGPSLPYRPGGGVKDVHASLRWNWALSPSLLLTTGVHAARLAGDAKASPLAGRAGDVTVSTALAYRF